MVSCIIAVTMRAMIGTGLPEKSALPCHCSDDLEAHQAIVRDRANDNGPHTSSEFIELRACAQAHINLRSNTRARELPRGIDVLQHQ